LYTDEDSGVFNVRRRLRHAFLLVTVLIAMDDAVTPFKRQILNHKVRDQHLGHLFN